MLFFDTETTGLTVPFCSNLEFQPRIIEIAIVKTDDEFNEIEHFESFLDPEMPVPAIITKITGIKQEQVDGQPKFKEVLPQIKRFFESDDTLLAHNLRFDRQLLQHELRRAGEEINWPKNLICTVTSSMHLHGYRMKLENLYRELLKEEPNQKHRALDDVRILIKTYKALKNANKN